MPPIYSPVDPGYGAGWNPPTWGGAPPSGGVPPQPPADAKPEHPIVLPPDQVWPPLGAGGDFAGGWVIVTIPGVGVKWIWVQFEPQPHNK